MFEFEMDPLKLKAEKELKQGQRRSGRGGCAEVDGDKVGGSCRRLRGCLSKITSRLTVNLPTIGSQNCIQERCAMKTVMLFRHMHKSLTSKNSKMSTRGFEVMRASKGGLLGKGDIGNLFQMWIAL